MRDKNIISSESGFVGICLDSNLFTSDWIQYIIKNYSQYHKSFLFVIADDLLKYTRSVKYYKDKPLLVSQDLSTKINNRKSKFIYYIRKEMKLSNIDTSNISVRLWSYYIDDIFFSIYRNLFISYHSIAKFRSSIDSIALKHINRNEKLNDIPEVKSLSMGYLLDEIAMCIRITEFTEFSYEYYPRNQLGIVEELYNNKFRDFGLTVESLINKIPKRKFFMIKV